MKELQFQQQLSASLFQLYQKTVNANIQKLHKRTRHAWYYSHRGHRLKISLLVHILHSTW